MRAPALRHFGLLSALLIACAAPAALAQAPAAPKAPTATPAPPPPAAAAPAAAAPSAPERNDIVNALAHYDADANLELDLTVRPA